MVRKLFLALAATFLCGVALAAGARLFNATDFVAPSREAATLNAEELKKVAFLRSKPGVIKTIQVTKVNLAALAGGAMTLVLPNGKELEYTGSPVENTVEGATIRSWVGTSASGGQVFISHTDTGFGGQIHERGKTYHLGALPGRRYFALMEIIPRPYQDDTPPPAVPPPTGLRK